MGLFERIEISKTVKTLTAVQHSYSSITNQPNSWSFVYVQNKGEARMWWDSVHYSLIKVPSHINVDSSKFLPISPPYRTLLYTEVFFFKGYWHFHFHLHKADSKSTTRINKNTHNSTYYRYFCFLETNILGGIREHHRGSYCLLPL